MRAFFRITTGMDPGVARRQIEDSLLSLDPSFVVDAPFLADFLGIQLPEMRDHSVDPTARHARLRHLVARMVKAEGRPLSVVVFEDLHWLDEPSQDFLKTIVEAASGTNFLVLLNYRPAWECPWRDLPHFRQLALVELEGSDIETLVQDLVGDDPGLRKTVLRIARQAATAIPSSRRNWCGRSPAVAS